MTIGRRKPLKTLLQMDLSALMEFYLRMMVIPEVFFDITGIDIGGYQMIWIIMGSAFLFSALLAFGVLGLLVEWIAYWIEVKERKKVKAAVWRLIEKDEDWRERKCQ